MAQREADLQAQRDLVNTLESALNDSERNLRKARQTSIEHARERDQYRETAERLERAVAEAQSASEKYRQSMVDLEERLQEQRTREARAARARLELEARMDEANKRKSKCEPSPQACFGSPDVIANHGSPCPDSRLFLNSCSSFRPAPPRA